MSELDGLSSAEDTRRQLVSVCDIPLLVLK